MSAKDLLNTKAAGYAVLAAGVIVAGWLVYRQVKKGAAAAANAVNPTNPDNVVNSAVTAVGSAISGDQSWSFGSWLYDISHPAYDPNAGVTRAPDVLQKGAQNTESLWGRIGGVILRTN